MNEPHLDPDALVERWKEGPFRATRKTLANWRSPHVGRGPKFRRFGRCIYYKLSDVEHFEATGQHWSQLEPSARRRPRRGAVKLQQPKPAIPPQLAVHPSSEPQGETKPGEFSGHAVTPEVASIRLGRLNEIKLEALRAIRIALHYRRQLERLTGREVLRGVHSRSTSSPVSAVEAKAEPFE